MAKTRDHREVVVREASRSMGLALQDALVHAAVSNAKPRRGIDVTRGTRPLGLGFGENIAIHADGERDPTMKA